jgi:hypothetical protein
MACDICISKDEVRMEIVFFAETIKGEAWLDAPTRTIPVDSAQVLKEAAERAGLTVCPAL